MNATQQLHKHIYKNKKYLAKHTITPKKMIQKIATLAFVSLFSTLNIAISQVYDAELEREIQRLEKQKKILELKRQNKKLQKELDDDSMPTPQKTQNPTSKQNPQNQTPYYAPTQAPNQASKNQRVYIEEEDDDKDVVYAENDRHLWGYVRFEGGFHTGLAITRVPQVNLELGLKTGDKVRVFLGGSYAWGKRNQYIANGYIGVGYIPKIFDTPMRVVLDSYIGGAYGEWESYTSSGYFESRYEGGGFLLGAKVGFAFDLGSHAQLEIGARIEASLGGLLNAVATPMCSFSILF